MPKVSFWLRLSLEILLCSLKIPIALTFFTVAEKCSAARSTCVPQTNACTHTLLSNESRTISFPGTSDALKHEDPHENNGHRNLQIEKPLSSKLGPCMTRNIKCEGMSFSCYFDVRCEVQLDVQARFWTFYIIYMVSFTLLITLCWRHIGTSMDTSPSRYI